MNEDSFMGIQMIYERGSGVRKAAILILALGDELAREIFKRLGEDDPAENEPYDGCQEMTD